jgi:hypothetical protein
MRFFLSYFTKKIIPQMTNIDNTNELETKHTTSEQPVPLGLYNEPIVKLEFNTDAEFQEWMTNVANKQGIWYLKNNYNKVNPEREELLAEGRFLRNSQTYCCDRYGTPRKPRKTGRPKKNKKRRFF